MKNNILKILIFIVLSAALYIFLYKHMADFKAINKIDSLRFIILSLITLMIFFLNGLAFKKILEIEKIKLRFKEYFGLILVSRIFNYLLFKAGPIMRAKYIKNHYKLSFRSFFSVLSILSLLQAFTVSLISLLLMVFSKNIAFNLYIILLYLAIISAAAALLALINFQSRIFKKIKFIPKKFLLDKLPILNNCRIILFIILLNVFALILSGARIYFLYSYLFSSINFSKAILIAGVGILSLIVSLTPASLGLRELLMAFTASLYGLSPENAAVVAIIDRAITMIWIFSLGSIFMVWFYKNMNPKESIN